MECHASQGRLTADLRHSLFSCKTNFKFHPQLYNRPRAAPPLLSNFPLQWEDLTDLPFSPTFFPSPSLIT